jgi:site-specific DNA-methyltransferase (adenine-specific)
MKEIEMVGKIVCGDCLDVMASMPDSSVDSIVTDPPYGLSFMGKDWDHGVPGEVFWREALRVAKPGAHLLAFGGTRTHHRLMCAIEDAGWEIRDCLGWLYGSGFPKSLDVSKAIDKMAGAEREVVGRYRAAQQSNNCGTSFNASNADEKGVTYALITAPATPEAVRWNGWGTALKPAWEPIVLARKPIIGTVAQNVLEYGTGALNIDGCRVGTDEELGRNNSARSNGTSYIVQRKTMRIDNSAGLGRFPANLLHDGSEEVEAVFPVTGKSSVRPPTGVDDRCKPGFVMRRMDTKERGVSDNGGSASRFFYCAKASSSERGEGNSHPTVKPLALMQYLCKLITPPNGIVFDPFCGSGSTLLAAKLLGFQYLGVDISEEYCTIARKRLMKNQMVRGKRKETKIISPTKGGLFD